MKKFTGSILAAALIVAMTLPAGALDYTIEGFSEDFGDGKYTLNGNHYFGDESIEDLAHLEAMRPGSEIFFPLRADFFEWEYDSAVNITGKTAAEMNLTLNKDYIRGDAGIFETLAIANKDGRAGILIRFIDSYPSVEEYVFDVDVELLVDGHSYEGSRFHVSGTLSNRTAFVNRNSTRGKLGLGRVLIAYDDVDSVTFDVGGGVSIVSGLRFYDKVYGAATAYFPGAVPSSFKESTLSAAKVDSVMASHPSIVRVIGLETEGFSMGNIVRIDAVDEVIGYIYDDNLDYLGTTGQLVAKRQLYYVATQKL